MAGKLEIQWSSVKNKFITWGAEISLYEIQPISKDNSFADNSKLPCYNISDTYCAQLLTTNTNYHYVRSIDIYPKCEVDLLLAIGLANGRVSLTTFGPSEHDLHGFPGKELVPRHSRYCNAVLFNPVECNILAAGLEKYKTDNSILIWDINKLNSPSDGNNSSRMAVNTMASAVELLKPVAELAPSEVTYSLAWIYGSSRVLASGMNGKNIKIYDLRDPNKMVYSTTTKAVFGICANPFNDKQLASFIDNQVCVWDTRNLDKPAVIIQQTKPVLKIGWCPTKVSCIASLQKESSSVNLYQIKQEMLNNEEHELHVMERSVVPGSPHNITSFSWHPTDENRLLTIALSGAIKDYTVCDRITINSSPQTNLVWSYGKKMLRYIDDFKIEDISYHMKERAKLRYGIQQELNKNGEVVKNHLSLANVWNWLHLTEKLVEDGMIKDSEYKHPGVLYVLSNIELTQQKSETVTVSWSDLGYPNCQTSAKYYRHEVRDKALQLCSWPLDKDSQFLTEFVEKLEKAKAYTRAAAIAVFNLKIQLAIEILGRAPSDTDYGSSLNVVAMALSGFSDDPNSLWRQNCLASLGKLMDPYLKVMFSFLTANDYNYDEALNENGIAVDDRVALACLYLPDEKLLEYVKRLSDELCNEGNLDGLLVTGNSSDGLKLLQKYLDCTADIQSTTLIATRAFHDDLGSERVKNWILHYQDLLNRPKMFEQRADFDIMLASFKPNERPPQQVYVSCNFCGKSISAYIAGQDRSRLHKSSSSKTKLSSCPNCRKPLPRCAICLQYMGTTTGESSSKSKPFEEWFTWCQTCRHGGHAGHICDWFEEHQECPVSGCTCRCASIDSIAAV
ncbi:GATOR complex protein mio [Leptinotarsa decemlineata]|uniref:GATOR complex protein mio n=1 Tax=Leptinotarsa decemlineata TaxID=7539 RepID=UPI003D30AA6B